MSKDLSTDWMNEDEDIIEEEETVFGGSSESPYIQGYGAFDCKITMAKILKAKSPSKTEYIEIDFVNKDSKEHREKFMVRGKDGKTFHMKGGKKIQHYGVNKIKSLLKVSGLYKDSSNTMKELYSNTEEADVTYKEFGKEKTEEFTIFNDLIGCKVKLCITSKDVNATSANDKDSKYIQACVKATTEYQKANPKKKSIQKLKATDDYVNVYKHFTQSSVAHFCSIDGLFASEIGGEGFKLKEFIEANDKGTIFEARTLIVEELTEGQLSRLGINEWGKVEDKDDEEFTESEEVSEDESW